MTGHCQGWRHWASLLLVLAASGVMVRLGFWQLDRLAQRRETNARLQAHWQAPTVDLNLMPWPDEPATWEGRRAAVRGVFDHRYDFAIKNRVFQGQTGLHLVTPLRVEGRATWLVVVRGWLPPEYNDPARWEAYRTTGSVTVHGRLFLPEAPPASTPPPATFPRLWYHLDFAALARYLDGPLAGWYLVTEPEPTRPPDALPRQQRLSLELSNGPHLGYAIQWFLFAALLPVVWWRVGRRGTDAS